MPESPVRSTPTPEFAAMTLCPVVEPMTFPVAAGPLISTPFPPLGTPVEPEALRPIVFWTRSVRTS